MSALVGKLIDKRTRCTYMVKGLKQPGARMMRHSTGRTAFFSKHCLLLNIAYDPPMEYHGFS